MKSIRVDGGDEKMYCPSCGTLIYYSEFGSPPSFCPSCGGKIDVEIVNDED